MFFRMLYKSGQIFLPFCHNARVLRTDRQTDGQTEFSSLDRVCIACSAVKTNHLFIEYKKNIWFISNLGLQTNVNVMTCQVPVPMA